MATDRLQFISSYGQCHIAEVIYIQYFDSNSLTVYLA
jgi:hypothetical protein